MLTTLIQRLWRKSDPRPSYALPDRYRVYAIGDVHGRFDQLLKLESLIRGHDAAAPAAEHRLVVFLGDYIDRGPDSRAVIEHLLERSYAGMPARCLVGNHEAAMLEFLEDPEIGPAWLSYGGMATLASYGVSMPPAPAGDRMEALRHGLAAQLPPAHISFLQDLEPYILLGDILFVHAGVRPGRVLEKQSRTDLTEIREPFLSSTRRLPWRVVHGHTVADQPELLPHRIGIDTGAYATGRLTCAVLEGDGVAILST